MAPKKKAAKKKPTKKSPEATDTQNQQRVEVIVKLQAIHLKLENLIPGGGSVEERQATSDELKAVIDGMQPL